MNIGIFAKTFERPSLSEVLDAAIQYGFQHVQFNMTSVGLSPMPEELPADVTKFIAEQFAIRQMKMEALSGTYNMIHPDRTKLDAGRASLRLMIQNARQLGTTLVTVCTGSRDPNNMWKHHPDNESSEAWRTLCESMQEALLLAEQNDIYIGVEPEMGNVINSSRKAKQLIREMQSNRLKIIFDPANMFEEASANEIKDTIASGLDLLGEYVIHAHAKDRKADGSFDAPGLGLVPFGFFFQKLREVDFDGMVITHGLQEAQVPACKRFLEEQLALWT